jgi:shikimate kinase
LSQPIMRVVLTGFMGTGKTAVGRRVAERLGRQLIDTDELIERKAGMPVREIFVQLGEPRFRELERAAVDQACAETDAVIATGGGTIVDERSFQRLAESGLMVCLVATPRAIARRVRLTAADRPLLKGHRGLIGRVRELLEQRAPVYARVPLQIDTSTLSVEQVADTVVAALSTAERRTPRGGGQAAAETASAQGRKMARRRATGS